MDVRNVPVLGVEDLEGAAGLDQVFFKFIFKNDFFRVIFLSGLKNYF